MEKELNEKDYMIISAICEDDNIEVDELDDIDHELNNVIKAGESLTKEWQALLDNVHEDIIYKPVKEKNIDTKKLALFSLLYLSLMNKVKIATPLAITFVSSYMILKDLEYLINPNKNIVYYEAVYQDYQKELEESLDDVEDLLDHLDDNLTKIEDLEQILKSKIEQFGNQSSLEKALEKIIKTKDTIFDYYKDFDKTKDELDKGIKENKQKIKIVSEYNKNNTTE